MRIEALENGAFKISELTDEEAQVLIQAGIDSTIGKDFNSEKYYAKLKDLAHDFDEEWEEDQESFDFENRGEGM